MSWVTANGRVEPSSRPGLISFVNTGVIFRLGSLYKGSKKFTKKKTPNIKQQRNIFIIFRKSSGKFTDNKEKKVVTRHDFLSPEGK